MVMKSAVSPITLAAHTAMGTSPCAWSDQIEDFLESKAREAAERSCMTAEESRVALADEEGLSLSPRKAVSHG
jgi:hypothetical protein